LQGWQDKEEAQGKLAAGQMLELAIERALLAGIVDARKLPGLL
jgi:hypothetical protein